MRPVCQHLKEQTQTKIVKPLTLDEQHGFSPGYETADQLFTIPGPAEGIGVWFKSNDHDSGGGAAVGDTVGKWSNGDISGK